MECRVRRPMGVTLAAAQGWFLNGPARGCAPGRSLRAQLVWGRAGAGGATGAGAGTTAWGGAPTMFPTGASVVAGRTAVTGGVPGTSLGECSERRSVSLNDISPSVLVRALIASLDTRPTRTQSAVTMVSSALI